VLAARKKPDTDAPPRGDRVVITTLKPPDAEQNQHLVIGKKRALAKWSQGLLKAAKTVSLQMQLHSRTHVKTQRRN
jgi:hypothetical protein